MRHLLGIAALASAIVLAAPSATMAHDPLESERERLEELARDGLDRFMQMIDDIMDRLPEFRAPEITPEGDIIIRRPRQKPDRRPTPEPDIVET